MFKMYINHPNFKKCDTQNLLHKKSATNLISPAILLVEEAVLAARRRATARSHSLLAVRGPNGGFRSGFSWGKYSKFKREIVGQLSKIISREFTESCREIE